MLTNDNKSMNKQIEFVSIDQLVPKNHLVRKIDKHIDFTFIYDLVKDLYSDVGRPSIDPVTLFKIVFIQYIFGIRSMRQTIEEIKTNVAYRWFLGYGFYTKVPHHSTFSKNYERRFKDTDTFELIFENILNQAIVKGFIDTEAVYIDATHVKANANKGKTEKIEITREVESFRNNLETEINAVRKSYRQKPLKKKKKEEKITKKISTTDPDAGIYYKNKYRHTFAYSFSTACDQNNFILWSEIRPSNVHDSRVFSSVFEKVNRKFDDITYVAVDAGYKTPEIAKEIMDHGIIPTMPYKRPMTKKGFFKKYEYVYDEVNDCYICPNLKLLTYSTTSREGYKIYTSDSRDCKKCPLIRKCTNSKNQQKVINRHIFEKYIEETEHLRHRSDVKEIYKNRSKTIERCFADMKEKHNGRYTNYRGIAKVTMEALLIFTCMNMKKIALWGDKKYSNKPKPPSVAAIKYITIKNPFRELFSKRILSSV